MSNTSFAEKAIYLYVSRLFSNVKSRFKINGFEFDVALLDEKVLIEFNGFYWHLGKEDRDGMKKEFALKNRYKFIVIDSVRDSHDLVINRYCNYSYIKCYSEKCSLSSIDSMVKVVITELFRLINKNTPNLNFINSKRDYNIIMDLYNGDLLL